MRNNHTFPKDIEDGIKAYREAGKSVTGSRMFRLTAIEELLRAALVGYKPPTPISDQIEELRQRVERLEAGK